ncbi:MAG TPA: LysR family transcriptional regulator [Dongiaceae bacterium]|nr:LysR family transcriptional regulator [Dongiaceae bacterium]
MPDTEDFAIFVRVVELGSLSAAGRDMRLSAAVVSNRIARLEKDVGTRLLNRTTRHVSLTEEGSRYYDHCVVILNELEQAESAITSVNAEPRGPIKVTAPTVFGRLHVAPHVPRFLERHPQMQVRLHLTDALVDLVQERVDLAIRISELTDSTSIVRTLAPNRRLIVASPDYLKKHPAPKQPEDLLDHNCLLLRFPGSKQFRWTLQGPEGRIILRVSGNMDSNSGEALRDWCLAGHGLALKSLWEIVDDLNEGRLVPVLTDFPPPGHAIYAMYPHSQHVPPRVRAFIDFLAETYGPKPAWEKKLKVKLRSAP